MNITLKNLNPVQRLSRFILGMGLITFVYYGTGYLGFSALLPLAAIIPLMTATIGSSVKLRTRHYQPFQHGHGPKATWHTSPV